MLIMIHLFCHEPTANRSKCCSGAHSSSTLGQQSAAVHSVLGQQSAAVGLTQSATSAAGPVQSTMGQQSPAVGPVHSTVGQSGQVLGAGGLKQRPSLNLAMVF